MFKGVLPDQKKVDFTLIYSAKKLVRRLSRNGYANTSGNLTLVYLISSMLAPRSGAAFSFTLVVAAFTSLSDFGFYPRCRV